MAYDIFKRQLKKGDIISYSWGGWKQANITVQKGTLLRILHVVSLKEEGAATKCKLGVYPDQFSDSFNMKAIKAGSYNINKLKQLTFYFSKLDVDKNLLILYRTNR